MNPIVKELKEVRIFYLATCDTDLKPHVRPFGAVTDINDACYLCTGNTKEVYKQMMTNPNIEICGFYPDGSWLRLSGKAVRVDEDEKREAMLNDNPSLKKMYKIGDGLFEVFRIDEPCCIKYSKDGPIEIK